MVYDLIDGETPEPSWHWVTLPKRRQRNGIGAFHYTVEADGYEFAEIAELVVAGKARPYVGQTYPLEEAPAALPSVEQGHSIGKLVLIVS